MKKRVRVHTQYHRSSHFYSKYSFHQIASMDKDRFLEQYVRLRSRKTKKIKKFVLKSGGTKEHAATSSRQSSPKRIICLDSDMKLDCAFATKNVKTAMQNYPTTTSQKKYNDRLVINFNDYLALKKNNIIGKFNLKPVSSSPEESKKHRHTKDNLKFTKVSLKNGQLIKAKVKNPAESQRTFLLVPENTINTVKEKSVPPQNVVVEQISRTQRSNESNSPIKVFKNMIQGDNKKSNIQCSKDVFMKTVQTSQQSRIQSSNIQSNIKVCRKLIQLDHQYSRPSNCTMPDDKKKKSLIFVLRAHPHFSQEQSLMVDSNHSTDVQLFQSESYNDFENEHNKFVNLGKKISRPNHDNSSDEINCELLQQNLSYIFPVESESINQVFPVALTSSDSNDFEYVPITDDNEITNESEMQILGI